MSWQPGALLELSTPRFVVRTLTREDVGEDLVSWLAEPEFMLGLNLPWRRLSRAQVVRFVLDFDNQTRFFLGIFERGSAAALGFYTVQIDARNACAETAVVVGDRAWWGRDVVRETRAALLQWLFTDGAMHKVLGRPHGRNVASIYNYKALGFRCEAVLREQLLAVDGSTRLDQLVFGLLRSEWLARQ